MFTEQFNQQQPFDLLQYLSIPGDLNAGNNNNSNVDDLHHWLNSDVLAPVQFEEPLNINHSFKLDPLNLTDLKFGENTQRNSAQSNANKKQQLAPEASSTSAADPQLEAKRRKSSIASAKFRQKKKQREAELESSVKELKDQNEKLLARMEELEQENNWLKNLVIRYDQVQSAMVTEVDDSLHESSFDITSTVHSITAVRLNSKGRRRSKGIHNLNSVLENLDQQELGNIEEQSEVQKPVKIVEYCRGKYEVLQSEFYRHCIALFDLNTMQSYSCGLGIHEQQLNEFDEELTKALSVIDQSLTVSSRGSNRSGTRHMLSSDVRSRTMNSAVLTQQELGSENDQHVEQLTRIKSMNNQLSLLAGVVTLLEKLAASFDFVDYATTLVDAEEMFLQVSRSDIDEVVCDLIEDALVESRSRITAQVFMYVRQFYDISSGGIKVNDIVSAGHNLQQLQLIQVASTLDLQDRVVDMICAQLKPHIQSCFDPSVKIQSSLESGLGFIKLMKKDGQDQLKLDEVAQRFVTILSYLCKKVTVIEEFNVVQLIIHRLYPLFYTNLESLIMQKMRLNGESQSDLDVFVSIEALLQSHNLIPSDDIRFSDLTAKYREKCQTMQQSCILGQIRDLVTNQDESLVEVEESTERGGLKIGGSKSTSAGQNASTKSGKNGNRIIASHSPMYLPTMKVSVVVQTVVEMVYQQFQSLESIASVDQVQLQTLISIRNMINTWRFSAHSCAQREESLKAAVIFHNDSSYMAHHLTTISYHHSHLLQSESLKKACNFVDIVQLIRKASNQLLLEQTQKLVQETAVILGQYGKEMDMQSFTDSVISKLDVKYLNLLRPESLFRRTMGLIVDGVIQIFIQYLETNAAAAEQQSKQHQMQVQYQCKRLVQRVKQIFTLSSAARNAQEGEGDLLISKNVAAFDTLLKHAAVE
ncbi:hypothetical protein MIR68_008542 [Amoeboaphelidium protococcarum]|nr:hypothetical protein MIR68_008542 [Amoeboaphelidium protococcarum]